MGSTMHAVFSGSLRDGFRIESVGPDAVRAQGIAMRLLANGRMAECLDVFRPSSLDKSAQDHEDGRLYVAYTSGLSDGVTLYGPFPDHELAGAFAEANRDSSAGEAWEVFQAPPGVPMLRLQHFDVAVRAGDGGAPLGRWRGVAESALRAKALARNGCEACQVGGSDSGADPLVYEVVACPLEDVGTGKVWWVADNMAEALQWRKEYSAKGAHVVLKPEDDRPMVDVIITLERARAKEVLGVDVGEEEWLDESGGENGHPSPREAFLAAMLALEDIQAAFVSGVASSLDHGRVREECVGRALEAVALEHGVQLVLPLQISSLGEYAINVAPAAGGYGHEFARLLNQHNPRCGVAPGAILAPTNAWCFMNHFDAERLVQSHLVMLSMDGRHSPQGPNARDRSCAER